MPRRCRRSRFGAVAGAAGRGRSAPSAPVGAGRPIGPVGAVGSVGRRRVRSAPSGRRVGRRRRRAARRSRAGPSCRPRRGRRRRRGVRRPIVGGAQRPRLGVAGGRRRRRARRPRVPSAGVVDRAVGDLDLGSGRPRRRASRRRAPSSRARPAAGAARSAVRSSDGARRARVGAVVGGPMLVVVEGPPLVVGAVAGVDAGVPEERPALAGERGDVEVAVAVGVADRGRGLDPAAGELRPAGGLERRRARRRAAGRGRCRPAPGAPGPVPPTRATAACETSWKSSVARGKPGSGGAGGRVPGLLDVVEGQVLVDREQVGGAVQRQPALDHRRAAGADDVADRRVVGEVEDRALVGACCRRAFDVVA